MHKDELAEKEEIIEGCAQSEEERCQADKQCQNGQSSEQIIEILGVGPIREIIDVHIQIPGHCCDNFPLTEEPSVIICINKVKIG